MYVLKLWRNRKTILLHLGIHSFDATTVEDGWSSNFSLRSPKVRGDQSILQPHLDVGGKVV